MKRITKTLLGILTGVMIMGMTAAASEYTVTDTDAVLWTNGNTVVQADASAGAAVTLPPMEIGTPVHITGVTSNGYWRVEIDGATYYIAGAGLGDTIETDEYIRKYYAQPVIQNIKGITIKVDYTEWNKVTHVIKMGYTVTNNTPYTVDVDADKGYIYSTYEIDKVHRSLVGERRGINEDIEVETLAIAPGTSMSGYQCYHINSLRMDQISLFTVKFVVHKNRDIYGISSHCIRFEDVAFYDYTTTDIRVQGTDQIYSIIGFYDVK